MNDTLTQEYSTPEEYILFKIDEESWFLNRYAYHNDSIYYSYMNEMGPNTGTQESVNLYVQNYASKQKKYISDLRVLKNFKSQHSKTILYNTSNRHYLKEAFKLKWKLHPEKDSIAGILCYKASTRHGGRSYTAWYSPQIPIQDGPYVFQGLPGLITKVVDDDKIYSFELKTFQLKPEKPIFLFPFINEDYPIQLDRQTYIRSSRKEKENPNYRLYYKKITPEILLQLKEKRKTRFDLIIEKN